MKTRQIANNAALEETIKALQLRNDLLVQHSDAVARELNEKSLLIDTQNMELDNVHKMVLQRNLDLEMMTRYSDENQRKIEEYIVDANSYVEETHNLRLEIKKLSQSIHQVITIMMHPIAMMMISRVIDRREIRRVQKCNVHH